MKIAIGQIKPTLGNIEKNIEKMVKEIKKEIGKSDVIIFPELSLTGYLLEEMVFDVAIDSVPKELLELSKEISIIFGAVELGKDLYHYNSAFYLEDGEVKHIHRKVYLPTYGMFDEGRYFRKGEKIEAFETKFGRVGILICEDAFHQSTTFLLGQDGAEVVYVLTNSPLRVGKEIVIKRTWESILLSSALTNSYYIVMANRVGVEDGVTYWGGSMAYSPLGDKLIEFSLTEEETKRIEVVRKEIIKSRFESSSIKDENLELVKKEIDRIRNR